MKIELLPETTEYPLQMIGKTAGVCWGSDNSDIKKNVERAKRCILSGHGRVEEWPEIHFVVSEISSRCMREIGRHVVGTSYLQESTRYVNCKSFGYYTPSMSEEAKKVYDETMNGIKESYAKLLELGVSKEDAANVLPLGMHTKVVMKCNLRMLENFMNQRLCSRAYTEMRQFANMLKNELASISEEWKWVADNLFVPKCVKNGGCKEEKCCGRMPKL